MTNSNVELSVAARQMTLLEIGAFKEHREHRDYTLAIVRDPPGRKPTWNTSKEIVRGIFACGAACPLLPQRPYRAYRERLSQVAYGRLILSRSVHDRLLPFTLSLEMVYIYIKSQSQGERRLQLFVSPIL